MSLNAPKPIMDYYEAKNRHDIDAMLASFAAEAAVKDEGKTYVGHAAIRGWMEETTRKYSVTVEPETIDEDGERQVVRALVSGNFPGSPARLTYRFILRSDKIIGLGIG
ncbi:MAG TPA: nuclear transport factor 2 family protein [Parvularculaceae bacterium]|nr:nuclear transport factor 2 family protein [Amphiplicatus sp.]MCB9954598.1 nuclear transport factor 2 family protein [Caulobacterales bacterium]HPE30254.1 nuclear transport factor 2 family protein [Parvularculaceae bacterium]